MEGFSYTQAKLGHTSVRAGMPAPVLQCRRCHNQNEDACMIPEQHAYSVPTSNRPAHLSDTHNTSAHPKENPASGKTKDWRGGWWWRGWRRGGCLVGGRGQRQPSSPCGGITRPSQMSSRRDVVAVAYNRRHGWREERAHVEDAAEHDRSP